MEQEDLDTWYEEQKEKYTQDYMKQLPRSKNPDKLKKSYQKKMKGLHKKYFSRSEKNIKGNLKLFFIRFRIRTIIDRLLGPIRERFQKKKQ